MNYGLRFVTLYRRQGSRPFPWKRNAKKAKRLSEEALQIAVKRREAKSKREKKKGYDKIFEEIIVENFYNMETEMVNQVQEVQRIPYRINPGIKMPSSILVKLTKIKHKERILKGARESNK